MQLWFSAQKRAPERSFFVSELFVAMACAGMAAAAVVSAFVALAVVVLVVMAALHVRVKLQLAGNERLSSCIGRAGDASEKLYAGLREGDAGSHADTAADEHIGAEVVEDTGERAMAAAVGIDHLRGDDMAVLRLINLELRGTAKVLENLSVVVSDCNLHHYSPFPVCMVQLCFLQPPQPQRSSLPSQRR